MVDKNKKIKIPSLEERQKLHEKRLEELHRINDLIGSPELFVQNKDTDQFLDALGLKVKLIDGREITIEDCLRNGILAYDPIFYKAYFDHVGRLLGIPERK